MRTPLRTAFRGRAPLLAAARAVVVCLLAFQASLADEPAMGVAAVLPAARAQAAGPSLVLLTIDTLRADHLGSYGHTGIETPNLDRLAAEGVRFDQAATTTPLTLPAHASILTGRYPFHHGVRDNLNFRLADGTATLAAVLHDAGYATGAFVGASVLDVRTGIAQGFDTYSDPSRPVVPSPRRSELQVERRGAEVVAEASSWVSARRGKFFAWVHLFDPHAPYVPPEPFRGRYDGRGYDGEIAYVDAVVGDLLAGLDALGPDARPIVVVTADHGEGLGDHHELLHSLLVYDSTMRVPLIVWAPGRLPGGTVVHGQASVVDVLPTVLAMLGVRDPEADTRDGGDLRPLVDEPEAPGRPAYVESMLPLLQLGWSPLRGLRGADFKYILAPRPELYDLRADPGEIDNTIDLQPQRAAELGAQLAQIVGVDDVEDLEFGRRFVDPQLEKRIGNLRSLGYVGGAAAPAPGPRPDPKDDIEMLEGFQRDALGAERSLASQSWIEAEVYIDALAVRIPDHPMGYFYRGRARLGQGDLPGAIAALDEAIALAPGNTLAWLDLAQAHWGRGDAQRAYEVLDAAAAAFPSLATLPLRRGYYLQAQGRRDEAERAYLEARQLAPLNPSVLRRLANLYLEKPDLRRARDVMAELVAVEPGDAATWNIYGDVLCALGQGGACESARRSAVAAEPERADLYFKLGQLLLEQGDRAQAAELFRETLRRDPDHKGARDALAQLG